MGETFDRNEAIRQALAAAGPKTVGEVVTRVVMTPDANGTERPISLTGLEPEELPDYIVLGEN